jgi:hypothetical protein
MAKQKKPKRSYETIEESYPLPKFPVRSLLRIPQGTKFIVVSKDPFGESSFSDNIRYMQQSYCYPNTHEVISFNRPTTKESVQILGAVPQVLTNRTIQLGYFSEGFEGIYVNPPTGHGDRMVCSDDELQQMRLGTRGVYGVEFLKGSDFAFVPYSAFETGEQGADTFLKGGLARAIEHNFKRNAETLERILAQNGIRTVNVKAPNGSGGLNFFSYLDSQGKRILEVSTSYLADRGYAFGIASDENGKRLR